MKTPTKRRPVSVEIREFRKLEIRRVKAFPDWEKFCAEYWGGLSPDELIAEIEKLGGFLVPKREYLDIKTDVIALAAERQRNLIK